MTKLFDTHKVKDDEANTGIELLTKKTDVKKQDECSPAFGNCGPDYCNPEMGCNPDNDSDSNDKEGPALPRP